MAAESIFPTIVETERLTFGNVARLNPQNTPIRLETDNTDNILVKEVKNHLKWRVFGCLGITVLVILMITILVSMYVINTEAMGKSQSNSSNDIQEYVLPNAMLIVSTKTDAVIKGQLVIDNTTYYDFASISNKSVQYIEFINQKALNQWAGFKIYHLNDSKLTFDLIHSNNTLHTVVIRKNDDLSSTDTRLLQSFLGQLLCEHFVELSVKLGAFGYLGNLSHAIQDIHSFAQWIYKIVEKDENIDNTQWVDITEEFEKVNTINAASKNAGFWVKNMNELIMYSSNMYSSNSITRQLLGECGSSGSPISKCDNDCFGMCGPQCWCWSWFCGDCDCWDGCYAHDYHCSCDSFWSYCCLNFFWVTCDGSVSC